MIAAFRRRHVHLLTVLVIVIGTIATFGGFAAARDAVDDSNQKLLLDDAAQGSLVLSSVLSTLTSPFKDLGEDVTPAGVPADTFDAAALKTAGQTGASIALLHENAGHLSVIASVGHIHHSFGTSGDSQLMKFAATTNTNFAGVFTASNTRWIEEVYGKGYVPSGYMIYSEQPIAKTGSVTSVPGILFSGVHAAVYAGSVSPSHLILQASRGISYSGPEAVSVVSSTESFSPDTKMTSDAGDQSYPGQIVIAMTAPGNISGSFVAEYPWIILLAGILASLIVSGLIGTAMRRRDEALGLVDDLEQKNAELDEAMARQAQAEHSLRQAQRMEAVGQLAGGIAHDFNNLLQAIISYAEFLSESIDAGSDMQGDVAEIQKAAHRAADLTRQLLVFSRQDVTKPAVLDINGVVLDAERLLRHALGEDVILECHTFGKPCHVVADASELEMMLMNLAINARDAMPRGGALSVLVDTVDLDVPEAQAAGLAPARHVRIRVVDNGEGMQPEVAAKAFEPFFTTKETGRGTGLGLAMVYGITQRWGGSVSISTAVGAGTTITLLFPLTGDIPIVTEACPAVPAPRGDRDTVLLVEDQDGVRRSTSRILEAAGYQVVQAENAIYAAELYRLESVDILVTDLVMPGGVSGKDLADRLRLERPDLPVVFVSGYSAQTITERGLLPPLTDFVMKPFSPEDLLGAIAHAMHKKDRVSQ
jgi:signal transduction histidine kinase/ActR/RegA family two-component response regulator